jgi:serine/threonine-protein kinase
MLSPHIVKVLARGVHDGAPYIVYEHLEGEDLATRLHQGPALSIPDIETVIVHTCRALARSHAVGVLHRDIKPENLFVRVDAAGHLQLKVVDFGVSDVLGDPRAADAMVGTLEYMAPEVMLNERPPGTVSDLYALGVVAYECCTGRVPFAGETLGELLIALANGRFDPATAFRADLPPAIDGWFARALHRDPDARFGSAKEMAEQAHLVLKRQATPSLSNVRRVASSPEVVRISSMMAKAPPPPSKSANTSKILQRSDYFLLRQ